ncbi:MAG: NADPH:quinone reductase [Modestobacter sp.]|nr:NADPH:quinone reductase [Modestobacter sp.]
MNSERRQGVRGRAVRFDRYGDRDVLHVAEVDMPPPGDGEVLVRVRAAGINPGETAIRSGALHEQFPAAFPSGEGSDLAGEVAVVGAGVSDLAVGDEVLGWSWQRSSHAELVLVPATQLVPKPTGLSWDAAGALYVVGATAYAAARAVGAGPGDTVAVSAAAGGVGTVLVQLLRVRGARVLGIASEAHHLWLREHGVEPVAYGEGLADRLRAAAPGGVDAFIDLFGPPYVQVAVELGVAPDRIDTIVPASWPLAREVGARTEGSAEATSTEVLAEMAALVADGRIDLPIAATYPLERVRDAFAELEERHTLGKIVLVP